MAKEKSIFMSQIAKEKEPNKKRKNNFKITYLSEKIEFQKILGPIPAALDISPREPDRYQLRVAVLNVSNAIPIKRSFGQPVCPAFRPLFRWR